LGIADAVGLWAIAEKMPDRTAVVEPDGRVVTYAELAGEADRYGRGLQALGLRPGDSVATMLPNSAAASAARRFLASCRRHLGSGRVTDGARVQRSGTRSTTSSCSLAMAWSNVASREPRPRASWAR
jgi:acyl-CoA synthetase (AMP-forming)/AMP-acid ligase II